MANCNRCRRPMRSQRTPVSEAPGTIRVGSDGNCDSCTHFLATNRVNGLKTAGVDAVRFVTITTRAVENQDWRADALCAQTNPESFFPDNGGSNRDGKKTCLACDVQAQCLEYALERGEQFGIWGGTTERERRKMILARGAEKVDAA